MALTEDLENMESGKWHSDKKTLPTPAHGGIVASPTTLPLAPKYSNLAVLKRSPVSKQSLGI